MAQAKREHGCVRRISRIPSGCWEMGDCCSASIQQNLLRLVLRTQSPAKNLRGP
jgi:hypothetical protein